jgi:hypothetical protein
VLGEVRRPEDSTFTRAVNVAVVLDDVGGGGDSARSAFATNQRSYERVQRGRDVYSSQVADPDGGDGLSEGVIDAYIQVAGSLTEVVAGLRGVLDMLEGWSNVHLVLRMLFPGEPLDVQIRRLRVVGEHVLPALRVV